MFNSLKNKLKNIFKSDEDKEKKKEIKKAEKQAKKDLKEAKKEIKRERKEVEEIKKFEEKEEKQAEKVEKTIEKEEPELKEIEQPPEITKETVDKSPQTDIKEEAKEERPKEPEEVEKQGIFKKVSRKFTSTTITQEQFDVFFEPLELTFMENNVALEVIDKIKEEMEKELVDLEIKKDAFEQEAQDALKKALNKILIPPFDLIDKINQKKGTFTILFFGINGSGKTTTISKVANMLKENKITSILAAGDTFRAASIEQLMKHGENLKIKVIHQDYGADPAAVGFDAIRHAKSHGIKVVLIDTAGRMHTKGNLLSEMEKIVRVTKPDLKIFVAESITGNDATEQAKKFNEAFGIDATILTKADVDEKGGTALSIGQVTGKPILYLGTGQEYKDLEKFHPKELMIKLGLE